MKNKLPSKKDLERILKDLEDKPGTEMLGPEATDLERLKFDICQVIVKYMVKKDLTQRALAKELGINESLVSNLVHHKIHLFTVDRLMGYLGLIGGTLKATIKLVKAA